MKKISIFIFLISFCTLFNSYAWAVSGGGETCATAIAVSPGDHSTDGPDGGLGASACSQAVNSEWFKYVATADGLLEVSSCGNVVDTVLYIHTTGCGSEDCDSGGDNDYCLSGDYQELVAIYVKTGNTYLIEWTDQQESSGFNWTLAFTPGTGGGDTCGTALDVTPGVHIASGPRTGGGASSCSGDTNSEWFSYTPSKNGMINISSCGAGVDNVLYIHSGGPCGTENCAVGGDNDLCDDGGDHDYNIYTEQISRFSVTAGQTYYIEWTDQQDNFGFFWELTFNNVSTTPATNLLLLD